MISKIFLEDQDSFSKNILEHITVCSRFFQMQKNAFAVTSFLSLSKELSVPLLAQLFEIIALLLAARYIPSVIVRRRVH